jgi:hypothetical protein
MWDIPKNAKGSEMKRSTSEAYDSPVSFSMNLPLHVTFTIRILFRTLNVKVMGMRLVGHEARHAGELDKRHRQNGTAFPRDKPSSGLRIPGGADGLPSG